MVRGPPPFGLGGSGGKSGATISHSLSLINGVLIPPIYHTAWVVLGALILQSHLGETLTTVDMSAFGLGLVTATPSGPVQDLRRHWWRLPHERKRLPHESKEEPPHLGNRQRQELGGHEACGLACCFLLVRPPCRRCWSR